MRDAFDLKSEDRPRDDLIPRGLGAKDLVDNKVSRAIVLLGHGSRCDRTSQEFQLLHHKVSQATDEPAFIGYIEIAKPSLKEALISAAEAAQEVVVVPIQLGAASHVKNDIPLAIAGVQPLFPEVRFTSLGAMGDHPKLQELCLARAKGHFEGVDSKETALLFLGRGSSDPDANGVFYRMMRLTAEKLGLPLHTAAFIGITSPSLKEGLHLMAKARPKRLVVLPYFLFYGVLMERIEQEVAEFKAAYPWIKVSLADYLGPDELLVQYILERLASLKAKEIEPLACLSCKYRVSAESVAENVDGLKALLWSVRHSLTHHEAVPHVHAHAPLKKHILVCTNTDCADKGSLKVLGQLRKELKKKDLHREYKVTRTLCMGRCGEGPAVAVYPDGVWYREFKAEDCSRLVGDHLVGDSLLAERVDHVMQ